MKKINTLKADLMLLFVAVIWGTGFVVLKLTSGNLDVEMLLFLRFGVAALFVGLLSIKQLKKIDKKAMLAGLLIGAVFSVGIILQSYGILLTSVGNASFITGLNIVFVPFIYWILTKKRPGAKSFVCVAVCLIGMAVLTLDFTNGFSLNIGDLLVLICAIFLAGQVALTGKYAEGLNCAQLTFFELLVVALSGAVSVIIKGSSFSGISFWDYISIVYLGAIVTGLATFTQTYAQKYTSSFHAALILSLESVFGCIFGILFIKEIFTLQIFIGCIIIMIGILISELDISIFKKKSITIKN